MQPTDDGRGLADGLTIIVYALIGYGLFGADGAFAAAFVMTVIFLADL